MMKKIAVTINKIKIKSLFNYFIYLYFLISHNLHATIDTLLVTGCGRSGTYYMSLFLEKSGYDILHERLGNDGIVSWPMAVNFSSPWRPSSQESFQHVFHQVRHPLSVITSWMVNLHDINRDEWIFIRRHIPEIKLSDPLVVQCAKYWYYWNLLAEKNAEWRYRIEDLKEILPEFMERSGLVLDENILDQIPSNSNSWNETENKITWADLEKELPQDLFQNILDMAHRYGYSLEEFTIKEI